MVTTLPFDDMIDSRKLESILDYNKLTTSYKLFWFSGIFEEILNGNQRITFRRIVCRMIASAWYPILQYHLNFGYGDSLNSVVNLIHKKHSISKDIKESELLSIIENIEDSEVEKAIEGFYKYVPYRLLSPFYTEELRGVEDSRRNEIISELSKTNNNAFYRLVKPEKIIIINDRWYEYIFRNQNIILGWMRYKLIYYLQKKNPNVPAIPFKLSAPHQRDLTIAKRFWQSAINQVVLYDVYTEKSLTPNNFVEHGKISIDHFIPWSFVLHDELWNLLPTFTKVNSSKSNKLPKLDLYIDNFCSIQYSAFSLARNKKGPKNFLEDYLTINRKFDLNDLVRSEKEITRREFDDSLKSTINPLFEIAYNQGYELWQSNID